jgi:cell division protein FtsQ
LASSIALLTEKRRFHVRWLRYLAGVGLAAALAVALLAMTRSSLFHVRDIEVEGNHALSRAELIRRTGITAATNAMWLDEGSVERSLLAEPWIARVEVRVSLPWTVHISIIERTPVAVIRQAAGFLLVAGDGTALGTSARPGGLPLIQTPPASVAEGRAPMLEGSARALGALAPQLRSRVRRVTVAASSTLEIFLDDGVRISYGTADLFVRKAIAIRDVLAWADSEGEHLRAMDVSVPSAPAVVPAA